MSLLMPVSCHISPFYISSVSKRPKSSAQDKIVTEKESPTTERVC